MSSFSQKGSVVFDIRCKSRLFQRQMLGLVDVVTEMEPLRAQKKWYYSQDGDAWISSHRSVVTKMKPLRDSSQRSTKAKMGKHGYHFILVERVC